MATRSARKSSLFLIELIIAILFFSLSAAVCVRLFATAYLMGQQSTNRDAATLQAQSMAALFQNADGALDDVLAYANATETEEDRYVGIITENGADYVVTLRFAESERTPALTIEITTPTAAEGDDPLITLQAVVYLPLSVQHGEVAA